MKGPPRKFTAAARIALFAAFALQMAMPLAAWAQVAAPSILPATPGVSDPTLSRDSSIIPINAALLGWPSVTRIAGGVIRAERTTGPWKYAGPPLMPGDVVELSSAAFGYEGTYGGAVIAGERMTVGIDGEVLSDVQGTERLDSAEYRTAVAGQLSSNWAVGAGYGVQSDHGNNSKSRTTGYSAGASWRALERLYVGAAIGTDKVVNEATASNGAEFSGDRVSFALGVGYVGTGTVRTHLEAWTALLGAVKSGGIGSESGTITGVVAEMKWGEFLAGLSLQLAETSFESDLARADLTGLSQEITVGVAADHGFGLFYHYGFSQTEVGYLFKQSDYTSTLRTAGKAQSFTLVWQY